MERSLSMSSGSRPPSFLRSTVDSSAISRASAILRDECIDSLSRKASLARDYSGSNCGEGFDTPDLDLTGAQSQLIREVAAENT